MQKSYDISRLVSQGVGEILAIAANTSTSLAGVCSAAVNVYVQGQNDQAVLFHSFQPGRFNFEVRHTADLALWFEPALEGSDVDIALLKRAPETRVIGDVETSMTNMDPRPAINPELAFMMREMKLMRGEVRSLRVQARQNAVAAPAATPPAPPAEKPGDAPADDAPAETDGAAE